MEKSYGRARSLVESVTAYELRHSGVALEDIGERFGVSSDAVRKRCQNVERLLANGTLGDKVREAKKVLMTYAVPECIVRVEPPAPERLPVRSISGARFSPLY